MKRKIINTDYLHSKSKRKPSVPVRCGYS